METIRLALERHQRRREQGVPTLSVLVGQPDPAIRAWQDWVGSMGWLSSRVARMEDEHPVGWAVPAAAVMYLCQPGSSGTVTLSAFVETIGRLLTSLGQDSARAVVALAVSHADADAYLRDKPYSRAQAIFAEGMIEESTPAGGESTTDPARAVALLADRHVRPETISRFAAAEEARLQTVASNASDDTADRARSAAERFLFDLLDDLPETAGLFALNSRLGFCFGPMPAEVDLLAAGLRLAVEIDGYHHFRDPENYRRDRRKDALLQRQGYLVLRFLAEDVVVRLEDILEEIRAAVAFRRATRG